MTGKETSSHPFAVYSKGPLCLLPCGSEDVGWGYEGGPTSSSVRHSEPFVIGGGKGTGDAAPMTESCGEKEGARSRPLTLAMPASSRLLHWMAGSEVGAEVKLCLADKNGAAPKLPTGERRRGHFEIGRRGFFFSPPKERRAELRRSRRRRPIQQVLKRPCLPEKESHCADGWRLTSTAFVCWVRGGSWGWGSGGGTSCKHAT